MEQDAPPKITLLHHELQLQVRPASTAEKRQEILEAWYRSALAPAAALLIAKWEPILGVKVEAVVVRRMKTQWGSCSPRTRHIRLNTELAKKPPECLEYIVVHELLHLLEPTHNARFIALLDHYLPRWQSSRALLNSLPARHETWTY